MEINVIKEKTVFNYRIPVQLREVKGVQRENGNSLSLPLDTKTTRASGAWNLDNECTNQS